MTDVDPEDVDPEDWEPAGEPPLLADDIEVPDAVAAEQRLDASRDAAVVPRARWSDEPVNEADAWEQSLPVGGRDDEFD